MTSRPVKKFFSDDKQVIFFTWPKQCTLFRVSKGYVSNKIKLTLHVCQSN